MDEREENTGFTRGGLIKIGAVAAFAVGAGSAGRALAATGGPDAAASGIGKPSGGAAYLRHAIFVTLVGSTFRFHVPDVRPLRVKLLEARKLGGPGESFSLLFRGDKRASIADGTYRLEHPSLGAFELFVSPVGRGVKGQDLEAVINRIKA
jgi:Domain of unknown function (DUF6916)